RRYQGRDRGRSAPSPLLQHQDHARIRQAEGTPRRRDPHRGIEGCGSCLTIARTSTVPGFLQISVDVSSRSPGSIVVSLNRSSARLKRSDSIPYQLALEVLFRRVPSWSSWTATTQILSC